VEKKEVSEVLVPFVKLTYPKTFPVLDEISVKHYFRLFFMFDGVFFVQLGDLSIFRQSLVESCECFGSLKG